MVKLNKKLTNISPNDCISPELKIIKFKSISEYIWDINEPVGRFQYIVECLKQEKVPEFLVISKPNFYNLFDNSETYINNNTNIRESESIFTKKQGLFDEGSEENEQNKTLKNSTNIFTTSFVKTNLTKKQNMNNMNMKSPRLDKSINKLEKVDKVENRLSNYQDDSTLNFSKTKVNDVKNTKNMNHNIEFNKQSKKILI